MNRKNTDSLPRDLKPGTIKSGGASGSRTGTPHAGMGTSPKDFPQCRIVPVRRYRFMPEPPSAGSGVFFFLRRPRSSEGGCHGRRDDAHGSRYALAVRLPDGSISVETRPWYSLTNSPLLRKPFLRGFPTLVETLVNGIKALNRSAECSAGNRRRGNQGLASRADPDRFPCPRHRPVRRRSPCPVHRHELAWSWRRRNGVSFHIWDGLFKFLIFLGYILSISLLPDIRRVFCYHGAEHKTIHAYESGREVDADSAQLFSRLHPRCGTTFLLFVMSIAILLHTVLVPLFLLVWTPESPVLKHMATIFFKVLLMVPISALSYELIRYAARLGNSVWGRILRAPGMFLQLLTTREPDKGQLEVAVAALAGATGKNPPHLETPSTCQPE